MQFLSLRQKLRILVAMFVLAVGLDQITKELARQYLQGQPTQSYFFDTIRILYSENTGAFLGMGAFLPAPTRFLIFTLLVSILLGGLLLFVLTRPIDRGHTIVYTGIIGGGMGNLIDRLMHNGAVTDFLNVGIGGLRTGIFNVADMFITFGIVTLFVLSFTQPEPGEAEAEPADAASADSVPTAPAQPGMADAPPQEPLQTSVLPALTEQPSPETNMHQTDVSSPDEADTPMPPTDTEDQNQSNRPSSTRHDRDSTTKLE